MGATSQDLKFGFRLLLQRPLPAIAITLSLALGIGANSAVFSVVDAVLFRPLNVGNPSRLVSLYTSDFSGSQYGGSSYADFSDFRDRTNVFESLAAFCEFSTTMTHQNQPERIFGLLVSANYFELLGIEAAIGRTFQSGADSSTGDQPALVMSHSFWRRRFGGDPAVVGRSVLLNNNNFTVIGVTPESFTGTDLGRSPEVFVPQPMYTQIGFEPALAVNRGRRQFSIMGRLQSTVSVDQAQSALNLLARQLSETYPDEWKQRTEAPRRISLVAERYARVPPEARGILMRLAGLFVILVGLVLLVACSNVSNMLLARAAARQKEMAVRIALGASRKRLVRQLLTESLQLALLGSVVGILIGPACIRLLASALLPASTDLPLDIGINARVILSTLFTGLITGVIFGLAPALHTGRTALPVVGRKFAIRNLLVMTQVAFSLLLLIVAGVFIGSLRKAQNLDLGYNLDNVLTVRPDAEFLDGPDAARRTAFYGEVLERVRALPGVQAASFADAIPSGGGQRRTTIAIEDYTPRGGEDMDVLFSIVGTEYFRTMGMTMVGGREFTDADSERAPRTAIVNETMSGLYWPGQNPLGKRMDIPGIDRREIEVVGVVSDATVSLYADTRSPAVYLPLGQNPSPGMALHVRTVGDPLAMFLPLRNAMDALAESVTLRDVRTLSDFRDESLLAVRIPSTVTGLFGMLALALALVGVFSFINYWTSRRTREFGIRLALGAQRVDILKSIMKEGLVIVAMGAGAGLLMAVACARFIASFMLLNGGLDITLFIALPALLITAAMIACFIPAYRATKINPIDAIRCDY
jgi:macrolide transport system ATP-binding/permease protein